MRQNIQVEAESTYPQAQEKHALATSGAPRALSVALLTGGSDRPYVYGLTNALSSIGVTVDLIGSDELDEPDFRNKPGVTFFNLRGDQRPSAGLGAKLCRIIAYYLRLIYYAATAKPKIFHILWNNKFEVFDRTLLTLYYKLLGKAVVLTAHNINKRKRDSADTALNQLTLKIQYRLADHVFVHTPKMKSELMKEFGVPTDRITVIPFGINNSVPNTSLTPKEAKGRLGIRENRKTILFFGRIKPYKGLEYLIAAFQTLIRRRDDYQLIIAGRLEEGCERYWEELRTQTQEHIKAGQVISRIQFIPDSEIEVYFKGADVLALPYKDIAQSGVIFLGYNFGLPVIAADVGSLKEEIIEGTTGFTFRPGDSTDLARALEEYFASDLFGDLERHRPEIREFARERHSWGLVSELTTGIYGSVLRSESENSPGTSSLSSSD
ncbi:MAG TPA: glycosyltransferase family 4 protein [Candidatus Acidoferrum sp.]|nr:glycosyltransferase family 4 protein [Candidatus Acidoferrum sp.]